MPRPATCPFLVALPLAPQARALVATPPAVLVETTGGSVLAGTIRGGTTTRVPIRDLRWPAVSTLREVKTTALVAMSGGQYHTRCGGWHWWDDWVQVPERRK